MSNGGLFQLISNDGKQDKMLMATDFLNDRLRRIRAIREADSSIDDKMPTLADIERTHVLFMSAHFKPFAATAYEYNKTIPTGAANLGSPITFSIAQFGDFFNDMCLHLVLSGPVITGTADPEDASYVRWVDFPGHRICQNVRFSVNGNPLDEYTADVYNMWYQFRVPEDKRAAWKRCVGQEVKHQGYKAQSATLLQNYRLGADLFDGPQTPKRVVAAPTGNEVAQSNLELFVPLLFWFNTDPRLSIPSVSIPYGQRFIEVTLASAAQLVGRVNRSAVDTSTIAEPTVRIAELYVNNIFVNPEVHDIFIKRIGFNLVRVHRLQTMSINTSSGSLLMNNLKWPIETLYLGVRPDQNSSNLIPLTNTTTVGQSNFLEQWHRFTALSTQVNASTSVDAVNCLVPTATIDTLSVKAHGVNLYNNFPRQFYNAYIPYTFGDNRAPDDEGLLMITFNLYPGAYQPSGHVNLSRAREFYLDYVSSWVSSTNTASLIVTASAINFLLIADGGAVLRYTT